MHQTCFYTAVRESSTSYHLYIDNINKIFAHVRHFRRTRVHNFYFLPPNHRTTKMRLIYNFFLFSTTIKWNRPDKCVNNITKCLHSSFFYIKSRNHSLFVDKTLGSKFCQAISPIGGQKLFSAFRVHLNNVNSDSLKRLQIL